MPVKLSRNKDINKSESTRKLSIPKPKISSQHTARQSKTFYNPKPSEKRETTVFRKSNPHKTAAKPISSEKPGCINSEQYDSRKIQPIGEPIVLNVASQMPYNVGYSSLVHQENEETILSGHILRGVNILPQEYKHIRTNYLNNPPTNEHYEEVIESNSCRTTINKDEKPSSLVEKFSWDKLNDSISSVTSKIGRKTEDHFPTLKQKTTIDFNQDVQNSTIQPSHEQCIPKTSPPGASSHDSYSMNFDDDIEAMESSKGAENIPGQFQRNNNVIDAEYEYLNVISTKGDDVKLAVQVLHEKSCNEAAELHQADDIVDQIYNKLHLSLDSACSTISDRLSTIPEDPRSYDEQVHNLTGENLISQRSSIHIPHIPINPLVEVLDADWKIEELKLEEGDLDEKEQIVENIEPNLSQIPDQVLSPEQSLKSTRPNNLSLSEGSLLDATLNNLQDNSTTTIQKKLKEQTQECLAEIVTKTPHDFSDQTIPAEGSDRTAYLGKSASQDKSSEPIKMSSCSKSTSSVISYSPQNSTDSLLDNKSFFYMTSEDSKRNQSSKLCEISNVSEGQVLNCGLLSEGELSQTQQSNEEISRPNISMDYLADESTNDSDVNRFSVPKQGGHQMKGARLLSNSYISNKRRQQEKIRQQNLLEQTSSSSDNSITDLNVCKNVHVHNEEREQVKTTLSEGELSANSDV